MLPEDLSQLYKNQNILTKFHIKMRYLRGKIWELERYLPREGFFMDLGCGHGVFANLLALSSNKRNVLGVDISESKISIAKNSIRGRNNIKFIKSDISVVSQERQFDVITLIDVLYLIPFDMQEKILSALYNRLKTSGVLLINEVCKDKSLAFYRALLQESISVKLLKITSGKRFYFRSDRQWRELLQKFGFYVEKVKRNTPNPTNLYICRKIQA